MSSLFLLFYHFLSLLSCSRLSLYLVVCLCLVSSLLDRDSPRTAAQTKNLNVWGFWSKFVQLRPTPLLRLHRRVFFVFSFFLCKGSRLPESEARIGRKMEGRAPRPPPAPPREVVEAVRRLERNDPSVRVAQHESGHGFITAQQSSRKVEQGVTSEDEQERGRKSNKRNTFSKRDS